MYASFHGEPTDETIEFQNEEHYHSHLAAIGELVELKVKLVNGGTAVIGFESSGEEEEENPKQKWLLPYKRGKKNYEDVGYLPYALEHDTGFGGDKMYRPVKYDNGQITVMSSELAGAHYDRYSRKSAIDAVKYLAAGMGKQNPATGNPFWPFNSFTHTTIYHVGTGEKYKAAGTHKGYTLYRKLDTDEFLVPALDKDSRFDTLKDAKAFVDSWTKHAKNPGGPLDTHAAKELELFVENDADLYRQQYSPINKNLITKMARGVYNHAGAVKLFGYLMESGAKKYAKEYSEGKDWHQIFSPATRKHVAELFADHFETEAKLGNYNNLLPITVRKRESRSLRTERAGRVPLPAQAAGHGVGKVEQGRLEELGIRGVPGEGHLMAQGLGRRTLAAHRRVVSAEGGLLEPGGASGECGLERGQRRVLQLADTRDAQGAEPLDGHRTDA